MAKISFTKLGLKKNEEIKSIKINEQTIEVKQFLPFQDKINMYAEILNNCQDDNNFLNEAKFNLWLDLEIIFNYTNISFTENQKINYVKTYDLLKGNGVIAAVTSAMSETELSDIKYEAYSIAKNVYDYRNSAYGILDAMKTDYTDLDFDAQKIQNEIADPENLKLLKDTLSKLG